MNAVTGSSPPADRGGTDEQPRVEAAGPVDAQNAPTRSLENAQDAFPTAPTRIDVVRSISNKCYLCRRTDLLPRSPAGQTLNPEPYVGIWTTAFLLRCVQMVSGTSFLLR